MNAHVLVVVDPSYVLTDIAPPRDPRRISTAAAALRLAEDSGRPVLAVPRSPPFH